MRSSRLCRILPFLCLVGLLTAAHGQQPQAATTPLVGSWLLRAEQIEVALELTADGRFTRTVKGAGGEDKGTGRYQVAGNVLQFIEDGETEAVAFQISMPDPNTLRLLTADGEGLELKRVTGGTAPPAGTVTAPMGGGTSGAPLTLPMGGGTSGAPLTLPMGGGMAAPAGGAPTAPVGGGGLQDPIPADLQQLVEALLKDFKASLGQIKPREEVPGWVAEFGPWGSVQRPPDWRVTKKGDYFMDLADSRGLTQLVFHTMVTFDGSPTFDEMAAVIFNKHTGTSQAVSLGTAAGQSLPFPVTDDSGVSQLWCLRWLHPQGGKMWGGLTVTVLARPPVVPGVEVPGLKTTCTYTFTSCPEAEAVSAHKTVFTPMLKSFWFPKGGGGQDSDGDGVNDNRDPAPFDPRVR